MKVKWFYFTPAPDGFDIVVRDAGADNGPVIADVGVRGEQFKKFVDDVLFQGLDGVQGAVKQVVKEETEANEADVVEHAVTLNGEPKKALDILDDASANSFFEKLKG